MSELEVFHKKELSLDEQKFLDLHNAIVVAGKNAMMYVYEFANKIKAMYDSKLYEKVGYNKFEDYTQEQLSIKKSQAYNYVKIAETYSVEFFHSNGKNVGVTKLLLLSDLGEEAVREVIKEVPIEDVSVKELRDTIDNLTQKVTSLEDDLEAKNLDAKMASNLIEKLKDKLSKEKEIVPTETVVDERLSEENESLKRQVESLRVEISDLDNTITLKDEIIEKLENVPEDPALDVLRNENIELKKKLNLSQNIDFNKFKVLFEMLSTQMEKVLLFIDGLADVEFKTKCVNAYNALIEGKKHE